MQEPLFLRAQRVYLEEPAPCRIRLRVLAACFPKRREANVKPILDEQRRALAEAHLGLVSRVLRAFGGQTDEDAFAAGCLGLCEAAAAWDGRGAFAPFAVPYIRRELHALAAQRDGEGG